MTPSRRLKIIEGQIRSLQEHVDADDYDCAAVMTQLKAIMSGIKSVGNELIQDSFDRCLAENITAEQKAMLTDVLKLYSSL